MVVHRAAAVAIAIAGSSCVQRLAACCWCLHDNKGEVRRKRVLREESPNQPQAGSRVQVNAMGEKSRRGRPKPTLSQKQEVACKKMSV
jgi:hypothetical protein